jgi:hypothetical protein
MNDRKPIPEATASAKIHSWGRISEVLPPEVLLEPFLPKQLVEEIRHVFLSPPS